MFEQVNTFWAGAASFAVGFLAMYSLYQVVVSRPKVIAYDFRTERIVPPALPDDFEISFNYQGDMFQSIHRTELIIKNETEAPLIDASFLSPPLIRSGNSIICTARKVNGLDDSRASIELGPDQELRISNLMIPIDSSATFEVISVTPIDQTFFCVHSEAKTIRRNYGWLPRSRDFLFAGPLFSMFPLMLAFLLAGFIFGRENANAYFHSVYETFSSIGVPVWLSAALTLLHVSLFVFVLTFLYQIKLRATEAEKRFTKLKQR